MNGFESFSQATQSLTPMATDLLKRSCLRPCVLIFSFSLSGQFGVAVGLS